MLRATEDFEEPVSMGAQAAAKVNSVQQKVSTQVTLHPHSSPVCPEKSPLTELWMWSKPARMLVHTGPDGKARKIKLFPINALVQTGSAFSLHHIPPQRTGSLSTQQRSSNV